MQALTRFKDWVLGLELVPYARELWLNLYSNRINLGAALFSAIYAGFEVWVGGSGWKISVLMVVFNLGAFVARMVQQPTTVAIAAVKAETKAAARDGS